MELDFSHLFLSLVISLVGFGYFTYGKKQLETKFLVSGLVLMGFSYFVSPLWLAASLAGVIAAAPFFMT